MLQQLHTAADGKAGNSSRLGNLTKASSRMAASIRLGIFSSAALGPLFGAARCSIAGMECDIEPNTWELGCLLQRYTTGGSHKILLFSACPWWANLIGKMRQRTEKSTGSGSSAELISSAKNRRVNTVAGNFTFTYIAPVRSSERNHQFRQLKLLGGGGGGTLDSSARLPQPTSDLSAGRSCHEMSAISRSLSMVLAVVHLIIPTQWNVSYLNQRRYVFHTLPKSHTHGRSLHLFSCNTYKLAVVGLPRSYEGAHGAVPTQVQFISCFRRDIFTQWRAYLAFFHYLVGLPLTTCPNLPANRQF